MSGIDLLDARVASALRSSGIADLLPVQTKAVQAGLLEGKNIIILAPTGSGKTLVGEIAAVHQAVRGKKSAILVPYKALAEERYSDLRKRWESLQLEPQISTGDHPSFELRSLESGEIDVVIFTYERFLSLITQQGGRLRQFSTVVVDELQMIAEQDRGGRLEWILTFLRRLESRPQIVGLSAVVEELNGLDTWLDARVVKSRERPVPLTELVVKPDGTCVGVEIISGSSSSVCSRISLPQHSIPGLVATLLRENADASILVFCPTVADTEKTARWLRDALDFLGPATKCLQDMVDLDSTEISAALQWCLERSVAFHNSELSADERALIERGFRNGEIKVIACTSTLAMGVNMPCTATIIAGVSRAGVPYTVAEYKNMAGRAGRLGTAGAGNGVSYYLARDELDATSVLETYVNGQVEPIRSSFEDTPLDQLVLYALSELDTGAELSDIQALVLDTFVGWRLWSPPTLRHAATEAIEQIVDSLVAAGLAVKERWGYSISVLGRICAAMGTDVQTFVSIVDWIKASPDFIPTAFLAHVTSTKSIGQTRFPTSWNIARTCYSAVRRILEEHNHGIPEVEEIIRRLDRYRVHHQHALPGRRLASALQYISGVGMGDIERSTGARSGTIRTLVDTYKWLTDVAYAVGEAIDKDKDYLSRVSELAACLEYGMPAPGHNLARLGVLRRHRLIALVEAGVPTPLDLLEAPDEKIASIIRGTLETARDLKARVMGALGPLLPGYKAFAERATPKSLTIVHRIYASRGTDLEKPVMDLFTTFLPELNVRRIRYQPSGQADFYFRTRDGLTGIMGLASRHDPKKAIGMTKACQVLQQSPELHPRVFVSLGFPEFDASAIQQARAHASNTNFKLITIPNLLDAVLRVEEGRLPIEQVYEGIENLSIPVVFFAEVDA